jgi:hypothetical protein
MLLSGVRHKLQPAATMDKVAFASWPRAGKCRFRCTKIGPHSSLTRETKRLDSEDP